MCVLIFFLSFSGGVLCDDTANLCGTTIATSIALVGGAVNRNTGTFYFTHVSSSGTQLGNIGFKLQYYQMPCIGSTIGDGQS